MSFIVDLPSILLILEEINSFFELKLHVGRVEGWQGESVGEEGDGGILGKWSGVVSKEGV